LHSGERGELHDEDDDCAEPNRCCIARTGKGQREQPTGDHNERERCDPVRAERADHLFGPPPPVVSPGRPLVPTPSRRCAAVILRYMAKKPAAAPRNTNRMTIQGELPSRLSSQTPAK